MKTSIFDRIFGNCENGVHKFRSFLIKETPPDNLTKLRGADASEVIEVINSLTKREYIVRCFKCGKLP
jgi:hypothetical protein